MNGTTTVKTFSFLWIGLSVVRITQDVVGECWLNVYRRAVVLPALSTASGHLTSRMTGAYAYVRKQFGLSIGRFEGVQEAMYVLAQTLMLEASRLMTAGAIDLNLTLLL